MPELPEVETIRRDLESQLLNERLVGFELRDRRLMDAEQEARWKREALGHAWTRIGRKGKYLEVALDHGWRLVFHMRMTGQLVLRPGEDRGGYRLRMRFAGERLSTWWTSAVLPKFGSCRAKPHGRRPVRWGPTR